MPTSTLEPLTILAPSPSSETQQCRRCELWVRLWLWGVPHPVRPATGRHEAHRRPGKRTAYAAVRHVGSAMP